MLHFVLHLSHDSESQFLSFVVTITERITAELTYGCWGHVNVSVGAKCGGVCKYSWTENMSAMLCENLGCGKPIQQTKSPENSQKVIITRLHTTTYTRNLTQSVMVMRKNVPRCIQAYVVCSGNV